MSDDEFFRIVEEWAIIGRSDAERAVRATLTTLAERISKGEARHLAEQLPPAVAPWLFTDGPAEPFGAEEFLRRVAEREGVEPRTAGRHARAVLTALARAVTRDELHDLLSELPSDFAPLLPVGRHVEVPPADDLLRRVAERAGLDPDGARRATEAVLETLAERISGGEVRDLMRRLPAELRPPLERGDAASHGAPRRMSLDDFLRRVAEREGSNVVEAREHARAVFATVREAVGEEEFADVNAELPLEFTPLLARP